MQLQILEDIFKKGNGTPTKQKIAEIALELAKHGHVSDVKVYNWFQNKRARSKKKQAALLKSSSEPESEAEIESSSMKKPKIDEIHENENLLQSELPSRRENELSSNDFERALCTQEQMPYYENAAHPGMWSHSFPRV